MNEERTGKVSITVLVVHEVLTKLLENSIATMK
jgi:hypothetical protein